MLEKPDLPDSAIAAALQAEYGLADCQITFLPLGADVHTAVYRAAAADGAVYFLKLRSGEFNEITVTVPRFLHAQSIQAVIPPLETLAGRLWGSLAGYKMILYPFVEGRNGFDVPLTDDQWVKLGAALRRVHTVALPPALARQIPREDFSPQWRSSVRAYQAQVASTAFADPVAARLAGFMREHQAVIDRLVARAEALADDLRRRPLAEVLCHADIHAGNVLAGAALYIVDWDNPILAPKERDLMFIGAGIGSVWDTDREEDLFYQGYYSRGCGSPEAADRQALAYYRCERVVEDIAAFCDQLLATEAGGADREQAYRFVTSSFLPDHEIDRAMRT